MSETPTPDTGLDPTIIIPRPGMVTDPEPPTGSLFRDTISLYDFIPAKDTGFVDPPSPTPELTPPIEPAPVPEPTPPIESAPAPELSAEALALSNFLRDDIERINSEVQEKNKNVAKKWEKLFSYFLTKLRKIAGM